MRALYMLEMEKRCNKIKSTVCMRKRERERQRKKERERDRDSRVPHVVKRLVLKCLNC